MDGLTDVSTLLLYVALQRLPALHQLSVAHLLEGFLTLV
jgi:hypothetical protein